MANFCKYCGKPLQDGEICSCPQAQAEAAQQYQGQQPPQGGYQQPPQGGFQQPPQGGFQQPPQGGYQQPPQGGYQQPPQPPAGPNPFVLSLQKLLPYLQSYLKSPVGAAQELIAQKDMIFAGILLGIQTIIGGLALFGILQGLCNFINGFTRIVSTTVGASIIWSMIFGILSSVVVLAIFIVLMFAVVKICGSGCTFLDVVVAAAAHSPFVSVLLLAGFLLFLLFMPLGAIVFLTAMLAWILLAIPTAQALVPNGAQGKFWICIIVGTALALVIGVWAATSLGGNAVGHMTIKYSDGKTQTFNEMGRNILSLLDMF